MENKHFKQVASIWGDVFWIDISQLTAYSPREVDEGKSVSVWFNGFFIIVEKETFDDIMEDLIHGGSQD